MSGHNMSISEYEHLTENQITENHLTEIAEFIQDTLKKIFWCEPRPVPYVTLRVMLGLKQESLICHSYWPLYQAFIPG